MTNKEEVIKHLILLKESAVKSHNDTGIINVKLDSFNFVMDMAIKALEYDDVKYHAEHGEVIVDKAVWDDAEMALSGDYFVGVDSTGRFVKASEVNSYHLSAPYQFR